MLGHVRRLLVCLCYGRCAAYGHDCYLEDFGGCICECCRRCPWTGRCRDYLGDLICLDQ